MSDRYDPYSTPPSGARDPWDSGATVPPPSPVRFPAQTHPAEPEVHDAPVSPSYGFPAAGPRGPSYGARPKTGLATAAMVLGLIGMFLAWIPLVGFFLAMLGVVFGLVVIATHRPGRGMAIAGVVTGSLGIALFALVFVMLLRR